jgi:drug/metabolite transporter (DMT)-like permease
VRRVDPDSTTVTAHVGRRDTVLLLVLSAIWGASFMFIKLGVEDVAPSVVALGRLVIGTVFLFPVAFLRGGLRPLQGTIGKFLALGLVGTAIPFWLLGFAGGRIDSGLSAELQASAPIATVLLARWLDPTQALRGLRLVGGELVAALAVVGTATCYAIGGLLVGRWLSHVPNTHIAFAQIGCASLVLAPFGIAQAPEHWPGWDTAGSVIFLGLLGTGVAYLVYFALIKTAGVSRAILVTYLVPAFALVYGAVFLDEAIRVRALVGLALILAGTTAATGLLSVRRARSRE